MLFIFPRVNTAPKPLTALKTPIFPAIGARNKKTGPSAEGPVFSCRLIAKIRWVPIYGRDPDIFVTPLRATGRQPRCEQLPKDREAA